MRAAVLAGLERMGIHIPRDGVRGGVANGTLPGANGPIPAEDYIRIMRRKIDGFEAAYNAWRAHPLDAAGRPFACASHLIWIEGASKRAEEIERGDAQPFPLKTLVVFLAEETASRLVLAQLQGEAKIVQKLWRLMERLGAAEWAIGVRKQVLLKR